MKRILITGINSYIGNGTDKYLQEYNALQGKEMYQIHKISQRDSSWENHDFSAYDTVLNVTGKAHADIGKLSLKEQQEYYEINCELAVKTAVKAKEAGVGQYIYMSSIIVYGDSGMVGKQKLITQDSLPAPANFYGDSKWRAEQRLQTLADENFRVAIVRPPFIYGSGCKGNYQTLAKIAERFPIFPTIRNTRSMLYIENLSEFIRLLIETGDGGIWFPQNAEYGNTSEMVLAIASAKGRKMIPMGILNPMVWILARFPGKIGRLTNKAFGDLAYDQSLSNKIPGYCKYPFEETIERTERKDFL